MDLPKLEDPVVPRTLRVKAARAGVALIVAVVAAMLIWKLSTQHENAVPVAKPVSVAEQASAEPLDDAVFASPQSYLDRQAQIKSRLVEQDRLTAIAVGQAVRWEGRVLSVTSHQGYSIAPLTVQLKFENLLIMVWAAEPFRQQALALHEGDQVRVSGRILSADATTVAVSAEKLEPVSTPPQADPPRR